MKNNHKIICNIVLEMITLWMKIKEKIKDRYKNLKDKSKIKRKFKYLIFN